MILDDDPYDPKESWTARVISPDQWKQYDFVALFHPDIQEAFGNHGQFVIPDIRPSWWMAKPKQRKKEEDSFAKLGKHWIPKSIAPTSDVRWFTRILIDWGLKGQGKGITSRKQKRKNWPEVWLGPSRAASWHSREYWVKIWKTIRESRVMLAKNEKAMRLFRLDPELSAQGITSEVTAIALSPTIEPRYKDRTMDAKGRYDVRYLRTYDFPYPRFVDFYDAIKENEGKASFTGLVVLNKRIGEIFKEQSFEWFGKNNNGEFFGYSVRADKLVRSGPWKTDEDLYILDIYIRSPDAKTQKHLISQIKGRFELAWRKTPSTTPQAYRGRRRRHG